MKSDRYINVLRFSGIRGDSPSLFGCGVGEHVRRENNLRCDFSAFSNYAPCFKFDLKNDFCKTVLGVKSCTARNRKLFPKIVGYYRRTILRAEEDQRKEDILFFCLVKVTTRMTIVVDTILGVIYVAAGTVYTVTPQ